MWGVNPRWPSTVLGQIHRAFHFRDRHVYVSLYKQYVQPHLEFAAPAWSPWNRGDIECLERVQERAVRAVSGLHGRTYKEQIVELGLPSLEDRRHEADMVQVYKILSESDVSYSGQWFDKMENARQTRHVDGPQLRAARAGHEFWRGFMWMRGIPHEREARWPRVWIYHVLRLFCRRFGINTYRGPVVCFSSFGADIQ
jgi:hypothetical protein